MEIIAKRKFARVALNANNKTFVMHIMAIADPITISIHPSCQAQVIFLMSEETGIPAE